jgi:hypothetical protein
MESWNMQAPFPYPAPAASAQPTQYPVSSEPFGAVHPSYATPVQHQRRRASPYLETQTTYSTVTVAIPSRDHDNAKYDHNRLVALFILPPLFLTLWNHASSIPLQTFLYLTLLVYAIDLANLREFYLGILWLSTFILSVVHAGTSLLGLPDEEAAGANMLAVLMKLLCECLLFGCLVSDPEGSRDLL